VEAGQISFGYDIAASEDKIFIHSRDIDASLSLDGLLGERLLLTLTSRQPGGLGPRPLADGFGDPENRDGDPSNDFVEVDFELATSPPPIPLPAAAWFMLTAVGALAGTRLLKGRAAEA